MSCPLVLVPEGAGYASSRQFLYYASTLEALPVEPPLPTMLAVASYALSRTLVPTLANYLLRKQGLEAVSPHTGTMADSSAVPARFSRNPLLRFQRGFEHVFEAIRGRYLGLLQLTWSMQRLAITHKKQQPSQGNEAAQDAPS